MSPSAGHNLRSRLYLPFLFIAVGIAVVSRADEQRQDEDHHHDEPPYRTPVLWHEFTSRNNDPPPRSGWKWNFCLKNCGRYWTPSPSSSSTTTPTSTTTTSTGTTTTTPTPRASIDKCPCVRPKGQSTCLPYNPELQAVSMQEAVVNFPNLATDDPMEAATLIETINNPERISSLQNRKGGTADDCTTPECQACVGAVAKRIEEQLAWATEQGANDTRSLLLSNSPPAGRKFRYSQPSSLCPGFSTTQPRTPKLEANGGKTSNFTTVQLKEILDLIVGNGTIMERSVEGSAEESSSSCDDSCKRRRRRRQTGASQAPGTSTQMDCRYRRGDSNGDGFVGLCNLCWSWRILPSDYFPQFLNEVSCETGEDKCLSGYGKCRPRLRSVNVLRNFGSAATPNYQQQSITTTVACECQVEAGSSLHQFVRR